MKGLECMKFYTGQSLNNLELLKSKKIYATKDVEIAEMFGDYIFSIEISPDAKILDLQNCEEFINEYTEIGNDKSLPFRFQDCFSDMKDSLEEIFCKDSIQGDDNIFADVQDEEFHYMMSDFFNYDAVMAGEELLIYNSKIANIEVEEF